LKKLKLSLGLKGERGGPFRYKGGDRLNWTKKKRNRKVVKITVGERSTESCSRGSRVAGKNFFSRG